LVRQTLCERFALSTTADLLGAVWLAYTVEALLARKNREETMRLATKRIAQIAAAIALFFSGVAAGTLHARSAAVENHFGQPKTVLHIVVYKFRDDVSNYDRVKAIDGIKEMAGKIPGIKNIWLKTERNQARDFSGVYAIEFASAEAAADYAESPVHEAWSKSWQQKRENSLSFQVSNP
jgi:Stress responsive A/B Barrel Domain